MVCFMLKAAHFTTIGTASFFSKASRVQQISMHFSRLNYLCQRSLLAISLLSMALKMFLQQVVPTLQIGSINKLSNVSCDFLVCSIMFVLFLKAEILQLLHSFTEENCVFSQVKKREYFFAFSAHSMLEKCHVFNVERIRNVSSTLFNSLVIYWNYHLSGASSNII